MVFSNARATDAAFVNVSIDGSPPQCLENGVRPVNGSVSMHACMYVCMYVCVYGRWCEA